MGDGEVGNEFDIIFPHYRHGGADADEHDASPNPTQALMMSCLTADTNAFAERCQRDTGKKKRGSCLLTELVRQQMKHEMSILHTTQTYQILYGEGMAGKRDSNLCQRSQTYR